MNKIESLQMVSWSHLSAFSQYEKPFEKINNLTGIESDDNLKCDFTARNLVQVFAIKRVQKFYLKIG